MTESIKVELVKERETKRTWRFKEKGEPETHIVGTLYVQKRVLKELGDPNKITITIS